MYEFWFFYILTKARHSPCFFFFFFRHASGCEVVSHSGFDLCFLNAEWCWACYHVLISNLYILFGEMLIHIFCLFKNYGWNLAWATVWFWGFEIIYSGWKGFPGSSAGKESACNAGGSGLIHGLGRSPGEGHGHPLQYSCLEHPHGRRSWAGYSLWRSKELDMTEWLSPAHAIGKQAKNGTRVMSVTYKIYCLHYGIVYRN